jgi:diguanylate cyclase (GGDEF)-like protein
LFITPALAASETFNELLEVLKQKTACMKLKNLIYIFTTALVFFFGIFIYSSLHKAHVDFAQNQQNLYKVKRLRDLTEVFQSALLVHRLKRISFMSDAITQSEILDAEKQVRLHADALVLPPSDKSATELEKQTHEMFNRAKFFVYRLTANDNQELSAAGHLMQAQLDLKSSYYITELNKLYFLYVYNTTLSDTHSYKFIESVRLNNRLTLTATELIDQLVDIKTDEVKRNQSYLRSIELIGVLDSLRSRVDFIIATAPDEAQPSANIDELLSKLSKESMQHLTADLTSVMQSRSSNAFDGFYRYIIGIDKASAIFVNNSYNLELHELEKKISVSRVQLYGMISLCWLLALFIVMPILVFSSKISLWLTLTNKNIMKLSQGDLDISPDNSIMTGELSAISDAINQLRQNQIEKRLLETEKQELINELLEASSTDPLTNIYNRRKFFNQCSQITEDDYPLAFCLIDIDNFKRLNDRYGHDVGDLALIAFSQMLEQSLPKSTVYCRYGGEEFAILIKYENMQQSMRIIDVVRHRTEMLSIAIPNKPSVGFTISCGLARLDDYQNINHSIKQADEALYYSKKRGKNQVSFYSPNGFISFDANDKNG